MITNNKGKFTRNINLEIELGSKNVLFQTVEGDDKASAVATAKAAVESAILQARGTVEVAKEQARSPSVDTTVKVAEIAALTEDQKTLTANEIKAVTILLKYADKDPTLLTHPTRLIEALNAARAEGEGVEFIVGPLKIDRSDAKELERALKGDGKLKRADGNVDIETIVALTAVITENKKPLTEVGIGLGGAILVGQIMDNEMLKAKDSPIYRQLEELLHQH